MVTILKSLKSAYIKEVLFVHAKPTRWPQLSFSQQ